MQCIVLNMVKLKKLLFKWLLINYLETRIIVLLTIFLLLKEKNNFRILCHKLFQQLLSQT